jgi:hypothetical protein
MANRLSFELCLLERMSDSYASSTLQEIGIAEAEAARIRAKCPLKLPEQLDSDLATYASLLGSPVRNQSLGNDVPEVFAGSVTNYFILPLWPHLYWTVNTRPDGRSWGMGFRNQIELYFNPIDPTVIRKGLWTRSALENVADHHELYDGWDEQAVIRFGFGSDRYEGNFVFGLLQDWRKL